MHLFDFKIHNNLIFQFPFLHIFTLFWDAPLLKWVSYNHTCADAADIYKDLYFVEIVQNE